MCYASRSTGRSAGKDGARGRCTIACTERDVISTLSGGAPFCELRLPRERCCAGELPTAPGELRRTESPQARPQQSRHGGSPWRTRPVSPFFHLFSYRYNISFPFFSQNLVLLFFILKFSQTIYFYNFVYNFYFPTFATIFLSFPIFSSSFSNIFILIFFSHLVLFFNFFPCLILCF